jgi:hypothetical protein
MMKLKYTINIPRIALALLILCTCLVAGVGAMMEIDDYPAVGLEALDIDEYDNYLLIDSSIQQLFSIGDIVEVQNTNAPPINGLKVRYTPAGTEIVGGGKVDGDRGTIIGGPTNAQLNGINYVWWKIRWAKDNLEGWSAEGHPGGVYYLKKVGSTITSPSVSTSSATNVGSNQATLNGQLTSMGGASSVTVYFEYGSTTSLGYTTPSQSRSSTGSFSVTLTGGTPGTKYYYRAVASNSAGTVKGAIQEWTFQQQIVSPSVSTNQATNVGSNQATLNGQLTSMGGASSCTVYFEYGPTTSLGYTTPSQSRSSTGSFSVTLTGGTPGAKRYYRAVASNSAGTVKGAIQEWTFQQQIVSPSITGVDPPRPEANPTRQWLSILGSGFVSQSQVTLRIEDNEYPIPSDRTQFVNANKINVLVGLTDPGVWTVQIANPDNMKSNQFEFVVISSVPTGWGLDQSLVDLINTYAPDYYNNNWGITLSQYKAWIALISLREAGKGRYVAHSQWGGGSEGDRFNHINMGAAFRFSTGIGAFQLDRGGSQGNAKEAWHTMPTKDKLDPEKALLSTLRWHRDRFGSGATLSDFSSNSAWNAVKPDKESDFSTNWFQMTGSNWYDSKSNKLNVQFNPPIVVDQLYDQFLNIGLTQWSLSPRWNGLFDTWKISARNWEGALVCEYYYTYNNGWEIWVYNDPQKTFTNYFEREYQNGQFPESRVNTGAQVATAGSTSDNSIIFGSQPITSPSVSTSSATNVGSSQSTLNGELSSMGGASSCTVYFEYGTTTTYGSTTSPQSMGSTGSFSQSVSSLSPGTTYYYRAVATNSAGTEYGTSQSFTTQSIITSPSVSTSSATNVGSNQATLNGELSSMGGASSCTVYFEYGTTTTYGSTTSPQSMGSTGSFSQSVSSLSPGTTYYYRAVATNSAGTEYGTSQSFTTQSIITSPSVSTSSATNVGSNQATLNGELSSMGGASSCTVYFEYGTTTTYGSTTSPQSMGSTGSFSQSVSSLSPGTTYYYRAVAINSAGTVYDTDQSFITQSLTSQTIPITITSGTNEQILTFGTDPDGTDGFDKDLDMPAPPSKPSAVFEAIFAISDPLFPRLYTDIRGEIDEADPDRRWQMEIISKDADATISWNSTLLPEDLACTLIYGGTRHDMKVVATTTIPRAADGTVQRIEITISSGMEMAIPLAAGWNLVSIPYADATYVLPSPNPIQVIYAYNPATRAYMITPLDQMQPGQAYWVASIGATEITVTGTDASPITSELTAGWNLIGGTDQNVPFTNIAIDPAGAWAMQFVYGYNTGTRAYEQTTSFQPGHGYWGAVTVDSAITIPGV